MEIIFNPKAADGRGVRKFSKVREWLNRQGISCGFHETRYAGHATELAREAAQRNVPQLTVMGGDGTITEVINGIVKTQVTLGIVPAGTGNDIARSLQIPLNDPLAALAVIQRGRVRRIDLGIEDGRYFVSILGVGFPALVAGEANKMKQVGGRWTFFLAVYKGLLRMKAAPLRIQLDDNSIEMRCSSVMILNTPYTGGGLWMSPKARMDDGFFDVVVVNNIGKLDLMWNFPKVYSGRHLLHPAFSLFRSSTVTIDSPELLLKMFDGEVHGVLPVHATIVRQAVKVFA